MIQHITENSEIQFTNAYWADFQQNLNDIEKDKIKQLHQEVVINNHAIAEKNNQKNIIINSIADFAELLSNPANLSELKNKASSHLSKKRTYINNDNAPKAIGLIGGVIAFFVAIGICLSGILGLSAGWTILAFFGIYFGVGFVILSLSAIAVMVLSAISDQIYNSNLEHLITFLQETNNRLQIPNPDMALDDDMAYIESQSNTEALAKANELHFTESDEITVIESLSTLPKTVNTLVVNKLNPTALNTVITELAKHPQIILLRLENITATSITAISNLNTHSLVYLSCGKLPNDAVIELAHSLNALSSNQRLTLNILPSLGITNAQAFLQNLAVDFSNDCIIGKIELIHFPDPTVLLFLNEIIFESIISQNQHTAIIDFILNEDFNLTNENFPPQVFSNLNSITAKFIEENKTYQSFYIDLFSSNKLIMQGKVHKGLHHLFNCITKLDDNNSAQLIHAEQLIKRALFHIDTTKTSLKLTDKETETILGGLPNTSINYSAFLSKIVEHISSVEVGKADLSKSKLIDLLNTRINTINNLEPKEKLQYKAEKDKLLENVGILKQGLSKFYLLTTTVETSIKEKNHLAALLALFDYNEILQENESMLVTTLIKQTIDLIIKDNKFIVNNDDKNFSSTLLSLNNKSPNYLMLLFVIADYVSKIETAKQSQKILILIFEAQLPKLQNLVNHEQTNNRATITKLTEYIKKLNTKKSFTAFVDTGTYDPTTFKNGSNLSSTQSLLEKTDIVDQLKKELI